jgi:hypothetical protein
MNSTPSLAELAAFTGQSHLIAESQAERRSAVEALFKAMTPPIKRRGIGELLATVLTISSRTRRLMMPVVSVELDVFGPRGRRAVRLILPAQESAPPTP